MAKLSGASINLWSDGDKLLEPTCNISKNWNGGAQHWCWTCNTLVNESCSETVSRLNKEKDNTMESNKSIRVRTQSIAHYGKKDK